MTISMPRGDIRPVSFCIKSPDTNEVITDLDEIYFTVKKTFTERRALFQKRLTTGEIELNDNGDYQFVIEGTDTDGLGFGRYVFDIEIVRGNDIKQTFDGLLILTNEATHAVNEE